MELDKDLNARQEARAAARAAKELFFIPTNQLL